jgi:hypothetical protein
MNEEAKAVIEWVDINTLVAHPQNRNKHTESQILRLAEIIKYQGWRHPIIVSELSGKIVAGHGRWMAAKKIGLQKVPVHFQSFQSKEQEYAFLVSDNAIASWAELDLSGINLDLPELGPDFDIDLLGIEDFVLEPAELPEPSLKGEPKDKDTDMITCPNCGCLIERNTNG